ncbi:MAG: FtsX-like permease family protein, partial [Clostridiales bacterium]
KVGKKGLKKAKQGSKIWQMAYANVMRNRKKTILVVISLALSVVLLNATYSFTKGFDMDRYLEKFVVTDFVVASNEYFKYEYSGENTNVPPQVVENIDSQKGIESASIINKYTKISSYKLPQKQWQEYYKNVPKEYLNPEYLKAAPNDLIDEPMDIFGMDDLSLSYLKVVEGSVNPNYLRNNNAIIQVVPDDDYGVPNMDEARFKIGDKITVDYNDRSLDENTQKLVENNPSSQQYTVVATVVIPYAISQRYSSAGQYILHSDRMAADAPQGISSMVYLLNTDDAHTKSMEDFLKNYTQNVETGMNYESKASYTHEFKGFQTMFLFVGGALSLIIGIVGVLNFINAEITGIVSRKREIAMLQSIGMTGKQLKKMLIVEGLFYGIATIILSSIINLFIYGFVMDSVESLFWFFSKNFTMAMSWLSL